MRWRVNDGVHWHTGERGGAILNLGTGRWYWLNPTAAALWELLTDPDSDDPAAISTAPGPLAGVPAMKVGADLADLAEQLLAMGVLSAAPAGAKVPRTPRIPAQPVPASGRTECSEVASTAPERGAPAALWAAAAMLHILPTSTVVRLAHGLRHRAGGHRTVDTGQASAALTAVRRACAWYPGRAACLETSLAAALLCWAHRLPVTWNLGVRFDPHECHAWIAVDGQPVGEPAERDRALHPVLTV
ncbi:MULTISPECIES: lasso peptide biosynthesis B2 protein [unclassified Streptomyces]|uniref:lasso peptide biosynthesis B2 protein n=1 Tax=unclassified Streptomyces TaxID=2593676 RepID=UPI002E2E6906|nr:lasso peptide biosynthesis B2 protein [Streptomyces sp. NBC_00223]